MPDDLTARIRDRVTALSDHGIPAPMVEAAAAIRAVLDLHTPATVHPPCEDPDGHDAVPHRPGHRNRPRHQGDPVICQPCRTAADTGQPHDGCDNTGRDYRGCTCQHRPAQQPAPKEDSP